MKNKNKKQKRDKNDEMMKAERDAKKIFLDIESVQEHNDIIKKFEEQVIKEVEKKVEKEVEDSSSSMHKKLTVGVIAMNNKGEVS